MVAHDKPTPTLKISKSLDEQSGRPTEESTDDEHGDILSRCLQNDTEHHHWAESATDTRASSDPLTAIAVEQSFSATKSVVEPRSNGETDDSTHRLNGVEDTKNTTSGMVEVILPVYDGLKTIHHRSFSNPISTRPLFMEVMTKRNLEDKPDPSDYTTYQDEVELKETAFPSSSVTALEQLHYVGVLLRTGLYQCLNHGVSIDRWISSRDGEG